MKFLRAVEILMCCTSFAMCIAGAYFGYQMYLHNGELDAKVESQHAKIEHVKEYLNRYHEEATRQHEELADQIAALNESVSEIREELANTEPDDYQTIKDSVYNISKALFGVAECDGMGYSLRAFRINGTVLEELDALQTDIDQLKSDVLEAKPFDYYDVRGTVENLSRYVFGVYPKTTMFYSYTGQSLQEQIEALNSTLRDIEWALRFK